MYIKKTVLFASLLLFGAGLILAGYIYYSIPDMSYLERKNPDMTALMKMRVADEKAAGKKLHIRQYWVAFDNVPEILKKSIRITEDASFYSHEGVDRIELWESVKRNWEKGRYARGGSTITQQLAKNLFLSTEKSLLRKVKEIIIARKMEQTLSKNRIFQLYLNVIEFGPGIFGVEAASRSYFSKSVTELNLEEAVRLTAVIPRPLITSPTDNSRWLNWKSRWILGKLLKYGYISQGEYDETIEKFVSGKN
ncbi:MAG: monofunctional biosynthetic peptidoglycan transglycosylase [Calditrichaceae bacterium]